MSLYIDSEELLSVTGVKLPEQIAQTGYLSISGLPEGTANTMLSGFSGLMRPMVVLLLIEDGIDWKYYDIEFICIPKIIELNRANINYYLSQKLSECSFTVIGYLLIDDLMPCAPELRKLTPLALKAPVPLADSMTGLSWLQVHSDGDTEPRLYVANLIVSVSHRNKTYSVNGMVYKGCKEVRMSDIKAQQLNGEPMLYLPILKEHLH